MPRRCHPVVRPPRFLHFLAVSERFTMALQEGKLRAKQQQELDALIQKGARGRDELEISSVQDMERRMQRYRNLVAELTNLQKLEVTPPPPRARRQKKADHEPLGKPFREGLSELLERLLPPG